MKDDVMEKK